MRVDHELLTKHPLTDAHVSPVVAVVWLEGPQAALLSADSRGRVVYHPVTAYLSLTAMLAGAPTCKVPEHCHLGLWHQLSHSGVLAMVGYKSGACIDLLLGTLCI